MEMLMFLTKMNIKIKNIYSIYQHNSIRILNTVTGIITFAEMGIREESHTLLMHVKLIQKFI